MNEESWGNKWEKVLLLVRLSDEDLVRVVAEAGLAEYSGLCERARRGSIYLPSDLRDKIIK